MSITRNTLQYSDNDPTAVISCPEYQGRSTTLHPLARYTAKYALLVCNFEPITLKITYHAWELVTPIALSTLKVPATLRWAAVVQLTLRQVVGVEGTVIGAFLTPLNTLGVAKVSKALPAFAASKDSVLFTDAVFGSIAKSLKLALRQYPEQILTQVRNNQLFYSESELHCISLIGD